MNVVVQGAERVTIQPGGGNPLSDSLLSSKVFKKSCFSEKLPPIYNSIR